jgi:hypothetical protein
VGGTLALCEERATPSGGQTCHLTMYLEMSLYHIPVGVVHDGK